MDPVYYETGDCRLFWMQSFNKPWMDIIMDMEMWSCTPKGTFLLTDQLRPTYVC